MIHEDFITEVAKRLDWTNEKTSGVIEGILEVMCAELKMNNPVVIDDFGTLKTDIRSEYILLDAETEKRYLMPPSIEIVFETLSRGNEESLLSRIGFTPDEALYNEVNSIFSQFEPTPLNASVQFPDIPEIIALEEEEEEELEEEKSEMSEYSYLKEEEALLLEHSSLPRESPKAQIPEKEVKTPEFEAATHEDWPAERVALAGIKKAPPRTRSRGELKHNKRTSSVWIPIAGGIAIIVVSLFFFKREGNC